MVTHCDACVRACVPVPSIPAGYATPETCRRRVFNELVMGVVSSSLHLLRLFFALYFISTCFCSGGWGYFGGDDETKRGSFLVRGVVVVVAL